MNLHSVESKIKTRKMLTREEVKEIVRIKSNSSFDKFYKSPESGFPKPIKIGLRRLGWFEDEVLSWQEKSAEMRQ